MCSIKTYQTGDLGHREGQDHLLQRENLLELRSTPHRCDVSEGQVKSSPGRGAQLGDDVELATTALGAAVHRPHPTSTRVCMCVCACVRFVCVCACVCTCMTESVGVV